MIRDLNRATFIGVVGQDPETRSGADGRPVTAFPLLVDRQGTATGGHDRQPPEWLAVVTWDQPADVTSSRLRKNHLVHAEGRVQTRHWEEPAGEQRFLTELVASRLIALDCREPAVQGFQRDDDEIPLCLNRATVIGTLERDPEMRYTPGGQAITSFGLVAAHESVAPDRERQGWTDRFSVQALGGHAEFCNRHLSKGHRVYVEGEIRTRPWEQAKGTARFPVEMVASKIILLNP